MSLEQALAANTAAIEALTAAMKGGKAPAAGKTETKAEGKTGYEAKYSKPDMQAALNEVKEKVSTADAKKIIKEVGGADKMADITDPATIDKVYEAAKAKLKEADDGM